MRLPERWAAWFRHLTIRRKLEVIILVANTPEEIAFKLPKTPEYRSWQQVLNTTEIKQTGAEFASDADTKAPPRSVLAFAGKA